MIELESLQKALEEGIGLCSVFFVFKYCISLRVLITSLDSLLCLYAEAYDKMQKELMTATNSLTKILTSTDIKATVCVTLKHYDDVS